ncbi:MAG: hypothetical protein E7241_11105 [Lachnospiraceae bacterium]|nr:hypothetical protein [Lachnospiraceae bacterium]
MIHIKDAYGIDVYIEEHSQSDRLTAAYKHRRQLFYYYKNTLTYCGFDLTEEELAALKWLVDNMSEQAAAKEAQRLDNTYVGRLLAYCTLVYNLQGRQRQPMDPVTLPPEGNAKLLEIADTIYAAIKKALDRGLKTLDTVTINDNVYLYKKDSMKITDYSYLLHVMGEEHKGDTYLLTIDMNQELHFEKCPCLYGNVELI